MAGVVDMLVVDHSGLSGADHILLTSGAGGLFFLGHCQALSVLCWGLKGHTGTLRLWV